MCTIIRDFFDNFRKKRGSLKPPLPLRTGIHHQTIRYHIQGKVRSQVVLRDVSSLIQPCHRDWIMKRTTEGPARGIRWTMFSFLEDIVINFADDVAFLSHRQHDIYKNEHIERHQPELKISKEKRKVMGLNYRNPVSISTIRIFIILNILFLIYIYIKNNKDPNACPCGIYIYIYIKNNKDPNACPCGTPLKTDIQFETSPSTTTRCLLSVSNFPI